jgi:predicted small lipoprotein YifL
MRTIIVAACLLCLAACGQGPIYVAKNVNDGLKQTYEDPGTGKLAAQHQPVLQDIYQRFQAAQIDMYPGGLGFTTLTDGRTNTLYHYLLVQVRPRNITFGMLQTKPEQRFSEVFGRDFEKNLRYIRPADLKDEDVEGLAFAVHWPVRDLSQCDTYGGFVEYILMYISKPDALQLFNNQMTFSEIADKSEIVTSLDGKAPVAVKVREVVD